jgi:hydroxyacylglutathione hydrolase
VNVRLMGQTILSTENFLVEQFEDKGLAHFSYAVMAEKKIILIDPKRSSGISRLRAKKWSKDYWRD